MQPANGKLTIELFTDVETGPPITDLAQLITLLAPDDPDEADHAD